VGASHLFIASPRASDVVRLGTAVPSSNRSTDLTNPIKDKIPSEGQAKDQEHEQCVTTTIGSLVVGFPRRVHNLGLQNRQIVMINQRFRLTIQNVTFREWRLYRLFLTFRDQNTNPVIRI